MRVTANGAATGGKDMYSVGGMEVRGAVAEGSCGWALDLLSGTC